IVSQRVIGANDMIVVANIGTRSQGRGLMRGFAALDNVEVKTLCDVDLNLIPARAEQAAEIQGRKPGSEQDMRRVFDDQDIDAVVIAIPNHWHALATIWACQAGKHVFVEKPTSHNIWEGRKMVEAARKYDRIVQSGYMNRSRTGARQVMKFLHEGGIGDVYMARGLCFKPRDDIGRYPDGPMKEGETYSTTIVGRGGPGYTAAYLEKVDYDIWLGPAPKRLFNRNRFHYNWHWHWDYGNGDTGNQGPHQFDLARWGLNKDEHPVKIRSMGGMFAYDCAQETPNTQTSIFEYADGTILEFGTRGIFTNAEGEVKIGNLFYGTEGWLWLDGDGRTWQSYFGRRDEPGPGSGAVASGEGSDPLVLTSIAGGHYQNFTDAIRAGSRESLTCEIEVGHMSTVLPHLGNISYLVGRDLTFDGKKEEFVGDSEANKLLTRDYRKPYIVPSSV
ncbi:Gfo/Idh/MocA family oxidoreductase, partial [Candidatus Neomarinimicrobiota bacterium]